MKKKLLFMMCLFSFVTSFSQNTNNKGLAFYTFAQTSGTFSSISATGTALTATPDWDDGSTPYTNIGFTFDFDGTPYTQFAVNTNGTINFGSAAFAQATNNIQNPFSVNFMAPVWDDLKFYGNGTGDGIFYQLSGTIGSQVLTIEFFHVGRYNSPTTDVVNFQVKLYEIDSKIEFVFDNMANAANWHEYSSTSIGINKTTAKATEYLSVTPANPNATVSSTVPNNEITPQLLSTIAAGTTYSFTPPAVATDLDVAVNLVNSPTSNFLYNNEQISFTFSNPGIEITSGLSFTYTIFDLNTSLQIGTDVTQTYESDGTYPVANNAIIDFNLSQLADLSENSRYEITVTANLTGDVNVINNSKTAIVQGVVIGNQIYDNGPIVTQIEVGYNGGDVSQVQDVTYGFVDFGPNTTNLIGFRNADQFEIPSGETWTINGVGFYNWQTGSTTESTINYLDFRILDGNPALPQSTVLYDFSNQNKLSGSKWSGVYRTTENDILNAERPIMLNICNLPQADEILLTPGTYWIDWTSDGTIMSGPYMPYISILGQPVTGDSWHLGFEGWVASTDGSYAQGMPFLLYGNITVGLEAKGTEISVYPNPTTGIFNVITEENTEIRVIDLSGKIIYTKICKNAVNAINMTQFPKGIYFVRLKNDHKTFTEKIVLH